MAFTASWIAVLALALIVITPGLKGGFFFDDAPNIVENSAVHIGTLSFDALRASLAGPSAGPLGRPVSVLSFALTHYFFGLDPFAFKAINLAIHLLNGLLAAWFAALLLRALPENRLSAASQSWLALWIAAIWLVHPINFMPVMLAVQRMTLLSGMFMLLALICHLKAVALAERRWQFWAWLGAGWLLFWPLSVLSKETGLLFPLYILAVTFLMRTARNSPVRGEFPRKESWTIPAAIVALAIIALAMLSYLGWNWLETAYAMRPFTLAERLLTEARVLWFYAAQIVAPSYAGFGLYLDDFALSAGLLEPPATLVALTGWAAVVAGIWLLRRRQPLLCFALTWFLAGHALESTFLPLEIAHEYRNYLPSLGLIAGIGYTGLTFLQKLKLDYPYQTTGLLAVAVVLILAFITWLRAEQMSNPLLSSQIEATRHPQSARANHAAALALIKAGYGDVGDPMGGINVRFYLEQSAAMDASFKLGHQALIFWACSSKRPVEQQWIDEFAHRLEHTPYASKDLELPQHLLKPLLGMPKCLNRQDALKLFAAGASNTRISNSLRALFFEAAADYELLVSLDPRSAQYYLKKALALTPHDPALKKKLESFGPLNPD
ncbi:MAG: hypothetical protein A3F73_03650 [Gallionellales bacterium RIFCSPLOWO2_12_FULL_59_22]|nr:MAG: hypothetical protein A3H99_00970 [Gallionellales bacterium RIFCSPLOWO2_02_FULL_59_110]OGT01440.1 MAG: hypothetical protein A2Z65_13820 [Gallionellales bacterium RIFCSPLOWO2_02_58_13]OGT14481.1 MAG: hypothetical protein A3F73_03650 [Gallionellales bacterium RIFCSPLOWO2_12_FULL_59_22]